MKQGSKKMNNKKLLKDELKINTDIRTAIVYAVDELFYYIVEIHHQKKSCYIGNDNMPDKFGNMEDVVKACHKHKVKQAYIALSKTYQETDLTTDQQELSRYDYMPIKL